MQQKTIVKRDDKGVAHRLRYQCAWCDKPRNTTFCGGCLIAIGASYEEARALGVEEAGTR